MLDFMDQFSNFLIFSSVLCFGMCMYLSMSYLLGESLNLNFPFPTEFLF